MWRGPPEGGGMVGGVVGVSSSLLVYSSRVCSGWLDQLDMLQILGSTGGWAQSTPAAAEQDWKGAGALLPRRGALVIE
jgi:hypothetical protein